MFSLSSPYFDLEFEENLGNLVEVYIDDRGVSIVKVNWILQESEFTFSVRSQSWECFE